MPTPRPPPACAAEGEVDPVDDVAGDLGLGVAIEGDSVPGVADDAVAVNASRLPSRPAMPMIPTIVWSTVGGVADVVPEEAVLDA